MALSESTSICYLPEQQQSATLFRPMFIVVTVVTREYIRIRREWSRLPADPACDEARVNSVPISPKPAGGVNATPAVDLLSTEVVSVGLDYTYNWMRDAGLSCSRCDLTCAERMQACRVISWLSKNLELTDYEAVHDVLLKRLTPTHFMLYLHALRHICFSLNNFINYINECHDAADMFCSRGDYAQALILMRTLFLAVDRASIVCQSRCFDIYCKFVGKYCDHDWEHAVNTGVAPEQVCETARKETVQSMPFEASSSDQTPRCSSNVLAQQRHSDKIYESMRAEQLLDDTDYRKMQKVNIFSKPASANKPAKRLDRNRDMLGSSQSALPQRFPLAMLDIMPQQIMHWRQAIQIMQNLVAGDPHLGVQNYVEFTRALSSQDWHSALHAIIRYYNESGNANNLPFQKATLTQLFNQQLNLGSSAANGIGPSDVQNPWATSSSPPPPAAYANSRFNNNNNAANGGQPAVGAGGSQGSAATPFDPLANLPTADSYFSSARNLRLASMTVARLLLSLGVRHEATRALRDTMALASESRDEMTQQHLVLLAAEVENIDVFMQRFNHSLQQGIDQEMDLSTWMYYLTYAKVELLSPNRQITSESDDIQLNMLNNTESFKTAYKIIQLAEQHLFHSLKIGCTAVHDSFRACAWEYAGQPQLASLYAQSAMMYGGEASVAGVGHLNAQSSAQAMAVLITFGSAKSLARDESPKKEQHSASKKREELLEESKRLYEFSQQMYSCVQQQPSINQDEMGERDVVDENMPPQIFSARPRSRKSEQPQVSSEFPGFFAETDLTAGKHSLDEYERPWRNAYAMCLAQMGASKPLAVAEKNKISEILAGTDAKKLQFMSLLGLEQNIALRLNIPAVEKELSYRIQKLEKQSASTTLTEMAELRRDRLLDLRLLRVQLLINCGKSHEAVRELDDDDGVDDENDNPMITDDVSKKSVREAVRVRQHPFYSGMWLMFKAEAWMMSLTSLPPESSMPHESNSSSSTACTDDFLHIDETLSLCQRLLEAALQQLHTISSTCAMLGRAYLLYARLRLKQYQFYYRAERRYSAMKADDVSSSLNAVNNNSLLSPKIGNQRINEFEKNIAAENDELNGIEFQSPVPLAVFARSAVELAEYAAYYLTEGNDSGDNVEQALHYAEWAGEICRIERRREKRQRHGGLNSEAKKNERRQKKRRVDGSFIGRMEPDDDAANWPRSYRRHVQLVFDCVGQTRSQT